MKYCRLTAKKSGEMPIDNGNKVVQQPGLLQLHQDSSSSDNEYLFAV